MNDFKAACQAAGGSYKYDGDVYCDNMLATQAQCDQVYGTFSNNKCSFEMAGPFDAVADPEWSGDRLGAFELVKSLSQQSQDTSFEGVIFEICSYNSSSQEAVTAYNNCLSSNQTKAASINCTDYGNGEQGAASECNTIKSCLASGQTPASCKNAVQTSTCLVNLQQNGTAECVGSGMTDAGIDALCSPLSGDAKIKCVEDAKKDRDNKKGSEDCAAKNDGSTWDGTQCVPAAPDESICDGGEMGWFLCPLVNAMDGLVGVFMGMIESGLQYNYLAVNDANTANIKNVWNTILGIANIAFAIVFLIIIYSTATSTGLSNYDIKKILPRLIIAAILVNVSFWICAAVVDLSNILGSSAKSFFDNLGKILTMGDTDASFTNVLSSIGGTIFGLFIGLGMVILLAMNLGTVVLALLLIVGVLAFRSVLITILIMISPIAFVAWLLPNTEKWFKKWMTEFTRMLFIYPAIMFVWGASQFLSHILSQQASAGNFITVCLLTIVPVVAIIPIFKMGGAALGAIEGMTRRGLTATKLDKGLNSLGQSGAAAASERAKSSKIKPVSWLATRGEAVKQSQQLREKKRGFDARKRWANRSPSAYNRMLDLNAREEAFNKGEERRRLEDSEKIWQDAVDDSSSSQAEKDAAREGLDRLSEQRTKDAISLIGQKGYIQDGLAMQALAMGRSRVSRISDATTRDNLMRKLDALSYAGIKENEHTQRAAMEQTHLFNGAMTKQILDSYSGTNGVGSKSKLAGGLSKIASTNAAKIGLKGPQIGQASGGGAELDINASRLANMANAGGSKVEAGNFAEMDGDQMQEHIDIAKAAAASADTDTRAKGQQALKNLADVYESADSETLRNRFVGTSRQAAFNDLKEIHDSVRSSAPTPPPDSDGTPPGDPPV